MSISHITPAIALNSPIRLSAKVAGALASIARGWSQARKAQRLAEEYLVLSDAALAEHGTSREAVINQIRRVATDLD